MVRPRDSEKEESSVRCSTDREHSMGLECPQNHTKRDVTRGLATLAEMLRGPEAQKRDETIGFLPGECH
jgi:hypothetical protein